MNNGNTRPLLFVIFLLLLRIAIGWHFFYEGFEKVESFDAGSRSTTKPFSSAGYLRESNRPFAPGFRTVAGDPDKDALDRLVVNPGPGQLEGRATYKDLLPEAVVKDWDDYLTRFAQHYDLSDEQREHANRELDQAKELAGRWLADADVKQLRFEAAMGGWVATASIDEIPGKATDDPKPIYEVERPFENTTVKLKRSVRQRVQDYSDLVAKIKRIENDEQPAFDDAVRKDLPALKAEARALRTELTGDLNKFLTNRLDRLLTVEQMKKGNPPPAEAPFLLRYTDKIVAWGLLIVGGCLIIGFFSRTNAVLAALFLLSLYLSMPPWPGLADNPRAEGHYLIVNKNLIEMLALLVLATLPTGRWLGLDGLIHALNPFRKRTPAVVKTSSPAVRP